MVQRLSQNYLFIIGTTAMECFVYSPGMRVAYVISICLVVGFVAPWFINQELEFTPENHDVPGTCHIMMGVRMNCFPDVTHATNPLL